MWIVEAFVFIIIGACLIKIADAACDYIYGKEYMERVMNPREEEP
jgi:hypothetical protein